MSIENWATYSNDKPVPSGQVPFCRDTALYPPSILCAKIPRCGLRTEFNASYRDSRNARAGD